MTPLRNKMIRELELRRNPRRLHRPTLLRCFTPTQIRDMPFRAVGPGGRGCCHPRLPQTRTCAH